MSVRIGLNNAPPKGQTPQTQAGDGAVKVQTCIRKDVLVNQQAKSSCERMPPNKGGAGGAARRGDAAMYGANKRNELERRIEQGGSIVGNTAKGVVADQTLPQQYRLRSMKPDPLRSKTTVAAVMDMNAGKVRGNPPKLQGETIVRFDGAHNNAPTPHINIDRRPPGVKDPHTPISSRSLRIAGGTARTLEAFGKVARPVAIVTDAVRLGAAVHADGGTVGKNTAVTTGSVAGGWGGAAAGGFVGAKGGAAAGAVVGAFFGGVGAVPGAAMAASSAVWVARSAARS